MGKYLMIRTYEISDGLNIPRIEVDRIIKMYLWFCTNELCLGHRVDFMGIAQIVPDYEEFDYRETFAYKCESVAIEMGRPTETVTRVIQGYLESIKADIYSGDSANIYGMMTITPYHDADGKIVTVNSSISPVLQSKLRMVGNHARVFTNKTFAKSAKGKVIVE